MMTTDPADRTREGYIAGLRLLADLLESQPDIPYDDSVTFALGGTQAEAYEVIDRAAAALTAAGVPFECTAVDHHHSIELALAGLSYRFSRVADAHWAAHEARCSYEANVQVPVATPAVAGELAGVVR